MQHPPRPTPRTATRLARAGIALCAVAAALPHARLMPPRPPAAAPVNGTADGTVAPLTTAAPHDRPAVPPPPYAALTAVTGPARAHPTPADAMAEVAARMPGARARVALAAPGTYINELLRARDSSVTRWPARVEHPLTVWIADATGKSGWRPAYLTRVAEAFAAWTRAGVPVRFRLVADSATAEVHVAWTDHFREQISGRTVWSRDAQWWMTDANITLALHHSDGVPLDEEQMRAIALHEIGHLLGLDHTRDPMSIMAPRVRVRDLSAADAATVRLVYSLPPGHL